MSERKLGLTIVVTDAWLSGQRDPVPTAIPDLAGEPVFLLRPTDEEERLRIAEQAGYCARCEGEGRITAGTDRRGQPMLITCPRCRGRGLPMLSPEVMRAVVRQVVHGWSGWLSAEGHEIPYSEQMRDRIAVHRALYAVLVARAQDLAIRYEDELDAFFASSGDGSPAEGTPQSSSCQDQPSSCEPGDSSEARTDTAWPDQPART
jgi:hypothetical protein